MDPKIPSKPHNAFGAFKAKLGIGSSKSTTKPAPAAAVKAQPLKEKDRLDTASSAERSSRQLTQKNNREQVKMNLPPSIPHMHSDFYNEEEVRNGKLIQIFDGHGPLMTPAQCELFLNESVQLAKYADEIEAARARGNFNHPVIKANGLAFAANLPALLRTALRSPTRARLLDADPRWVECKRFNDVMPVGAKMHPSLYKAFHQQPPGTKVWLMQTTTDPNAPKMLDGQYLRDMGLGKQGKR